MEKVKEIERSIIKSYRKEIWSRFVEGVKTYNLIEENDHIMVCISGGKDSFLLAKCIQELIRHGDINFKATYISMNPGYNEKNKELILANALKMGIPLEMFESDIFKVVTNNGGKSPCYLCARMRRGYLYSKAKELGCNKIALGHHLDDVIETTLLSLFYGAEIKTMLPKLPSTNFPGLELIRPLYLVKEKGIKAWAKANNLEFLNCACRFTEDASYNPDLSKRLAMKNLIKNLQKEAEIDISHNIFKALDNINLNCVLGFKKDGIYHGFLDCYKEDEHV